MKIKMLLVLFILVLLFLTVRGLGSSDPLNEKSTNEIHKFGVNDTVFMTPQGHWDERDCVAYSGDFNDTRDWFSPEYNGTMINITMRFFGSGNNNSNITAALYYENESVDNPGHPGDEKFIAHTEEVTMPGSGGWQNVTFEFREDVNGTPKVYSDTDYIIALWFDDGGANFSYREVDMDNEWGGVFNLGHSENYTKNHPQFPEPLNDDDHVDWLGWVLCVQAYYFVEGDPEIVFIDDDFNASTPGWQYDHFNVIQDGIDAVEENGTVYVHNGTYFENVLVNKTIDLIGEDKNYTIVDGGKSLFNDTMKITADNVTIQQFYLRNPGEFYNSNIHVESDNNVISDNMLTRDHVIHWELDYGIYLINCSGNSIQDNVIWNISEGVFLDFTDDNIISNNIIYDTGAGIHGYGLYNTISHNTISESANGLIIGWMNESVVNDNIISHNNFSGIRLNGPGVNNTFFNNTISHNIGYGFTTLNDSNTSGNWFYHNNFINNSVHVLDYNNNTWDNGYPSGGNFFDDFDESSEGAWDNNSDGIVDSAYNISGGDNQDLYPLMYAHPIVTFDMTFHVGWNMITLPMEKDWNASDLIDNVTDCLMVSWFDAENQTFWTATIGGGIDFLMKPGWGYFVYVDNESVCPMAGSMISEVNVPLEVGWNMVGWYHENDTMASSLMENITGCVMVSWYDAVNETYRTATSSGGYDFTITQGMGLFVATTEASVWHGEG